MERQRLLVREEPGVDLRVGPAHLRPQQVRLRMRAAEPVCLRDSPGQLDLRLFGLPNLHCPPSVQQRVVHVRLSLDSNVRVRVPVQRGDVRLRAQSVCPMHLPPALLQHQNLRLPVPAATAVHLRHHCGQRDVRLHCPENVHPSPGPRHADVPVQVSHDGNLWLWVPVRLRQLLVRGEPCCQVCVRPALLQHSSLRLPVQDAAAVPVRVRCQERHVRLHQLPVVPSGPGLRHSGLSVQVFCPDVLRLRSQVGQQPLPVRR